MMVDAIALVFASGCASLAIVVVASLRFARFVRLKDEEALNAPSERVQAILERRPLLERRREEVHAAIRGGYCVAGDIATMRKSDHELLTLAGELDRLDEPSDAHPRQSW